MPQFRLGAGEVMGEVWHVTPNMAQERQRGQ